LRAAGIHLQVGWTTSAEQGAHLAKKAVEQGCDLIVAAGGDGTVEATARVLIGTPTAMGVLPLGTMNNLAHSIGIPNDVEAALSILAAGKPRRISVGMVQEQIFFEAVSVGVEAQLFPLGEMCRHHGIGGIVRLIYAGVCLFMQAQAHGITLDLDGRHCQMRAWQVTIVNAPHYGLGFTPTPLTRMDDEVLEVVVPQSVGKWGLLRHYWFTMLGWHSLETQTVRARRIRIEGDIPLPVAADGQIIGETPVVIQLWPDAMAVIAPPPSAFTPAQPSVIARIWRVLALPSLPRRANRQQLSD
jgi:diacylglycerol kinase (ATP)